MDIKTVKRKSANNTLSDSLSLVPTPFDITFPDGKNIYDKYDNLESGVADVKLSLSNKSNKDHKHSVSDITDMADVQQFPNYDTLIKITNTIFDKYTKNEVDTKIQNKQFYLMSESLPQAGQRNLNMLYMKLNKTNGNTRIVELQNDAGNILYPCTDTDAIRVGSRTLTEKLTELDIEEDTGTKANIVISTVSVLYDKYRKTFIAKNDNDGLPTNINGKTLYKTGTTETPVIKAKKMYTVWYSIDSDCFFLYASAEGTALQAHVLAGYSFSNDIDTGLMGTMPNRGTINKTQDINGTITLPSGYYDGITISQNVPNRGEYQYAGGVVNAGNYIALNNIPYGWYPASNNGWAPELRCSLSSMAKAIGLTADKLILNSNVCGVTGAATIQSMGGLNHKSGEINMVYGETTSTITLGFRPRAVSIICYSGAGTAAKSTCFYSDNTIMPNYQGEAGTLNYILDTSSSNDFYFYRPGQGVDRQSTKNITPSDTGFSILKDWAGIYAYCKWYAIG